jgi:hypothetical protein
MLTTILLILLIPIAAVAFICAAIATCGKAFLWVFRVLYELGKIVFVLFLAWIIFVCIT